MVRARQVDRGVALFLTVAQGYERDGFDAKALAIYRKIVRVAPEHELARQRILVLEGQQTPTSCARTP